MVLVFLFYIPVENITFYVETDVVTKHNFVMSRIQYVNLLQVLATMSLILPTNKEIGDNLVVLTNLQHVSEMRPSVNAFQKDLGWDV